MTDQELFVLGVQTEMLVRVACRKEIRGWVSAPQLTTTIVLEAAEVLPNPEHPEYPGQRDERAAEYCDYQMGLSERPPWLRFARISASEGDLVFREGFDR
jgi:hypothetical protein